MMKRAGTGQVKIVAFGRIERRNGFRGETFDTARDALGAEARAVDEHSAIEGHGFGAASAHAQAVVAECCADEGCAERDHDTVPLGVPL